MRSGNSGKDNEELPALFNGVSRNSAAGVTLLTILNGKMGENKRQKRGQEECGRWEYRARKRKAAVLDEKLTRTQPSSTLTA